MSRQLMKGKTVVKEYDWIIVSIVLYFIVGILIIKYYRYQINPDGVCYIGIAQKYAAGNFSQAINGYWSPLFSWLLVPFLLMRIDGLFASKILTLIIGSGVIFAVGCLARQFLISIPVRRVLVLSSISLTLLFAMTVITPDLLMTFFVLIYFFYIFKTNYADSKKWAVLCGLLGGISYLAKNYCFPFFIVHFLIMNILHYIRCSGAAEKSKIVKNFIYGMAVFAVMSGVWIGVLSYKYHKFMFSTAGGSHTASYIRWNTEPMYYQGFIVPPDSTAVSAWEDPSYLQYAKWSPWESSDDLRYYYYHSKFNVLKSYLFFKDLSYFAVPILIVCILFCVQRPAKVLEQHQICFPFLSLLIFAAGFCLVFVEKRYLWPTFYLVLVMGGWIVDRLLQNNFFTRPRRIVVYIFFLISFAYRPAMRELPAAAYEGKNYYEISQSLKKYISPGDKIASNDEWNTSLYFAYYLKAQYYGIPKKGVDEKVTEQELQKFGIDHYLVWQDGRLVNIKNFK